MGDTLTYAAHRALLPGQSLVREYSRADITSFPGDGHDEPGVGGKAELGENYGALKSGAFADWRLSVEGRVAKAPDVLARASSSGSRRGRRSPGTRARRAGPPSDSGRAFRSVSSSTAAGMLPTARFVNFQSFDDWVDSIDLLDALHPQTILAYGMNGRDLPITARRARPAARRAADGLQEHEVPASASSSPTSSTTAEDGNIQNGWAWYTGI